MLIIVASEMTNILNTLPSSLVTGASTLAGLFEESSPGFSLGVSVGSGVTVGIASVLWIVTVLSAHVFFLAERTATSICLSSSSTGISKRYPVFSAPVFVSV